MKATKKLVAASIALAAAASLTVGSTFAWFSYQSSVSLGAVNFSVDSSDENLQVAVTTVGGTPAASDYTYSLSADAIKTAINGGNAVAYQALTVKEDTKSGGVNTVSLTNEIELYDKDETTKVQNGDSYAAFDLVFRYTPYKTAAGTASADMPSLVLDYGSQITAVVADEDYTPKYTNFVAWTTDSATYGAPITENQVIKARARDAARVAFLFDNGGVKNNKVWAPSEERDASVQTSDTVRGFYKGNLASDFNLHYNYATDAMIAPTYASRVYSYKGGRPSAAAEFDDSKITKFPDVAGANTYSELRLTVKVWLEGKDGDCVSSVQEDEFAFLLKFRTSTVPTA